MKYVSQLKPQKALVFCLLMICTMLFSYNSAKAQTITIGLGTASSALYGPVGSTGTTTGARAGRYASIYPASLLSGISNGDLINSVEYNRATATNTYAPGTNLKIYIKNFPNADWGAGALDFSTAIIGATLVYDGDPASAIGNSIGWKQFVFSSPYVFNTANGTHLAVIYDYYQPVGTGPATTINWYYDNATQYPVYTSNGTKYLANTSNPPVSPTSLTSSTAIHPQIKINYTAPPACTTPPNAGSIQVAKQWYCGNETISLNLTGNSFGLGQTYQWQESTDDVNWSSIGAATNTSYSTTQNVPVKYYRAIATCSGISDTTNSVRINSQVAALSGNYTINKNTARSFTNFTSFNEAITTLNCFGVSGPVTFRVSSDTYNEQVVIDSIPGASSINMVRFVGNNSTIKFSSATSANRYVIRLNNADYIHLDSLTIDADEVETYSYAIHFLSGSSFNKITNNTIKSALLSTSTTNYSAIVFSGSTTSATTAGIGFNSNIIENNTIIGGYYSIVLYGTSANSKASKGNIIRNNIIRDAHSYSIYTLGCDSTQIKENDIFRQDKTNGSTFYGVYATTSSLRSTISRNKIHDPFGAGGGTTAAYGIYVNATDSKKDEFNVINNIIYNMNGTTGAKYGLYNQGSDSTNFFNNTVIMDDQVASTSVVNAFIHGSTAATGVQLMNNLFYINSPGTGNRIAEYWTNSATTYTSNYNGYYISNAGTGINAIAFFNSNNYITLADWQLFGNGLNSVSADPLFTNGPTGNHIPSSSSYDNVGIYLPQVLEDITGAVREITPDIGAYEFTPASEDVALTSVNLDFICVGSQPIVVGLSNSGINTLNSVQINWTVNGVLQTPFTYTGPLASSASDIVTIGQVNVIKDTSYSIVAWSSNPNGSVDLNTSNDTAKSKVLKSGLSGSYTIGGPSANYQSVAFVASELSNRGVCGPVTFNMDPTFGPYEGQVIFQNITGTDSTNTIKFNGAGSVVKAAPALSTSRSVILIESSDFITLDSLNIVADSAAYGWGVHLFSGSDNNVIKNSTVTVLHTSTSSNYSGIILSGSLTSATTDGLGANNLFENNVVSGGYYGIAINGLTNNPASLNNRVINNIVKDYYAYGIYLNSSDSALVSQNDISRPTRTNSTTTAGIYVSGNSMSVVVERNRIHDTFTGNPTLTSANYGIYQTTNDATATRPLIVRNNAIYNMRSNGIVYGIYNTGSNHALYYNNTVHIDDENATTSSAGYAFYQTTEATGIEVINNIFYINRAGSGPRAAVRYNTTSSGINSNYNNFYTTNIGTGVNALGYYGTATHNTISSWQSTSLDMNSYDVPPLLASPSNGDVTPNATLLNGTGLTLPQVTDDLNGAFRSSPPDIGALEFTIVMDDAGVTNIDSPNAFCPGITTVKVKLKNFGITNLTTAQINWQLNGVTQPAFNFTGSLSPGQDTSVAIGTFNALANTNYSIKSWSSLPNGFADVSNTNDTVSVSDLVSAMFGVYTIGGVSADFPTINAAVQALNVNGICDSVTFQVDSAAGPYNEQVLISNLPTSITKQVVFKGNGAIVNFEPTVSAGRYIFRIENTDYITIDGFNIRSVNGTYAWGVHVLTGSDNNTISNNKIYLNQTSTSSNFSGIVFSGSATSATTAGTYLNNKIIGNTVDGGYYGILVYGTSGNIPATQGHVIKNNIVLNTYTQSIYAIYQQNIEISGNTVSRPTRTSTTTIYGIEASSVTAGLKITNNKVHNLFGGIQSSTSGAYPIYLSASDHVGGKGLVANNLIYNINGGGIVYGIYNSASDSIIYAHNSISLEDKIAGKTSATYGFYQVTLASGLEYYNNSIMIDRTTTGNQVAMYFSTNTTIPVSNYNNFYTPNGYVAYHTSLRETLQDWRAVNTTNPYDLNSVFANPLYNGIENLIPQSNSPLVNSGTPIPSVTKDFEGTNRSLTTPYKGAFEKAGDYRGPYYVVNPITNTLSTANRTVNAVVSVTDIAGVDVTANNLPRLYYKKTTQENKYVDNTSATNGWKYVTAINTSSPFDFTIDYSKLFGATVSTNDEIEYFFVAQDMLGYVSSSHGTFKTQPSAITTIDSNQFPLNGVALKYRIANLITQDTLFVGNSHPITSLTTNTGLFKYLNENILAGDLTVVVTSVLSEDGSNALNEVTESGVGNYSIRIVPASNTVFNIQGSYAGGLIRLNGADRVTIDGSYNGSGRYFDIKNTSTASNTAAIQLIGLGTDTTGASYNTITNSVISTNTTSGNAIGIHIGGLTIPYEATPGNHHNKIINNKIYKGSVGIYNSGAVGGLSDSLVIKNNIIGADDGAVSSDNLRLYGLALEYGKNTIIENNTIQNIRNTGAQQSWGIAVYSNFDNGIISKNNIRNIVGGTGDKGGRGIELNTSTSNSNIRISNNFITGISGPGSNLLNSTANVGLYINGTGGVKVYYNSIHLSGDIARSTTSPDTSASIYIRGNAKQLDIQNNTFTNILKNTSDTSLSYAFISKVADTAFISLDYNNYYVGDVTAYPQGVLAKIRNTELTNLAALKSFNTANNSSISLNPNFESNDNLHARGVALFEKGTPLVGVTDDIDNDTRSTTLPCIGADEFLPAANEINVIGFVRPNSGVLCGLANDSIEIIVQNLGSVTQTNLLVGAYISGAINDTINNMRSVNLLPNAKDTIVVGNFNSTAAFGLINIKAFASVVGDIEPLNDTVRISTTTYPIPTNPVVSVVAQACAGSSGKLFANSNANIRWYNSLSATNPISTNDTLTTAAINSPTTFYVEATTSTAVKYSVGPPNTGIGAGALTNLFTYQVLFTVNNEVRIDSIAVFPSASGNVGIRIRDGLNTVTLHTFNFPITATSGAKVFLPLNLVLPPGDYRIDANTGTTNVNLFRNTAGSSYPYSDPQNNIVLTGHTFSGYPQYHYYFYDWKVRTGSNGCSSERIPFTINPTPRPAGAGVAQSSPFQGVFNAGTLANADAACVNDTLTYSLTPPTGFTAQDLGVTWNIINPVVKTFSGATPVGSVAMNGLSLQYVADAGDKDDTLVFTARVINLLTGCDTLISRYLKVFETPEVNLGADQLICEGTTVTLDAGNPGSTYLWSTGDTTQTINVSTTGIYSVVVTNAAGCESSDGVIINTTPVPVVELGADQSVCAGTTVILDAGNPGATYLWNTGATTQTIQVTTTGVYFVTATGNGGCNTSDSVQITVNPLPVVNLGAAQDICTSDTITLDAGNPGAIYLWSTGETTRTIRVSDAATYSVTVTNPTTGCIGIGEVVITNKATPVSTFSVLSANGLSVTFLPTVTSGLQYAWNFGDPSSPANTSQLTSPTHVFTASGVYTVTLTVTNPATNCKSTTEIQVTVTGVGSDFVSIFSLESAPNPFVLETQLSYVLPTNANSVSLEVYDVLGRKVSTLVDGESQAFGEHKYQFTNNNAELSSGVYIVRLTVDGKVANTRIIDAAKR